MEPSRRKRLFPFSVTLRVDAGHLKRHDFTEAGVFVAELDIFRA